MVFESVVVEVLNRFLGDYVVNLDGSQLKLGIWGGDVVLNNLELKENALSELGLPIKIIAGHLGKLTLKIPWKNLYTLPVIVNVEGLHLLAVPNSGVKYDAEKEEKACREAKKKELDRIEAIKLKEAEKGKTKEPDGFTEKLVAQIIKNVQVTVDKIHIRYEDAVTNCQHPFAIGVTLNNLTFQTTDQEFNLCTSGQDTGKFIYKLVKLDSLSVYWNSCAELYSRREQSKLHACFDSDIATSTTPTPGHINYVLGPINSTARMCLNPKPECDDSDFTIPKVKLTVDMQSIAISLSKSQYQDIMDLLQSLDRISLASLNREYRPNVPLKGNARIWWCFAYTSVVENGVRRRKKNWSWEHIFAHRNRSREYKDAYRQKLMSKKLSGDLKFKLEELEYHLDVFTITLARKQAEVEYARLGSTKQPDVGYTGWISSWFSSKKEKKEDDSGIVKQFEEAMSSDEKSKLYTAIGYQENTAPAVYPKTFVENVFSFMLHELRISIKNDHISEMDVVNLSLSEVFCHIKMRPSAEAIKVRLSVSAITASGHQTGVEAPVIASSLTEVDGKPRLLLDVLFETNPLDQSVRCDQRVDVKARPLEIVYHAETVNHLTDVFTTREAVTLKGLQDAAMSTLQDFKEMSATGLQHAIEVHKTIHLHINVEASHIIIPENGVYTRTSSIIVANLGKLEMKNMDKEYQVSHSTNEAERLKEMMDKSYDKFSISLTGVNILLARPGDDWHAAQYVASPLHLLKPTNLSVGLYKCFVTDDPRLAQIKVEGELPSFELAISDVSILELAAIVFSIPTKSPSAVAGLEPPTPSEIKYDAPEFHGSNSRAIKHLAISDLAAGLSDGAKADAENKVAMTQSTKMEMSFRIGKLGLTISHKDAELLTFEIVNFGMSMKQHTFDMSVDVFVGGITMEHKLFTTLSGGPLYILRTPMTEGSKENLLTVFYLSADKAGPEIHTVYKSILQRIKVRFTKLSVSLHQEAILDTVKFGMQLADQIAETQDRLKPPGSDLVKRDYIRSTSSLVESVFEFGKDGVAKRVRMKRKRADDFVDIQIDARLDSFSVSVFDSSAPITDMYIRGLEAGVTVQKSKTSIKATLNNIAVLDPDSKSGYSQILSFVDDNALEAKIVNFNNATSGNEQFNMNAFDTSLDVKIGRVRVIFLNKFVARVMDFVNQFQVAKEKVIEVGVQAAEAAKHNVQNMYKDATRLKIVFNMKAPLIVVPQNSQSQNVLLADLGMLSIENRLSMNEQLKIGNKSPLSDSFNIKLENFQFSRALFDPHTLTVIYECRLLEPITFILRVTRNLSIGWYKDAPEIGLSGKLEAVKLVMTQEDYTVTMAVLNENLSEGAGQAIVPSSEQETVDEGVLVSSTDAVVEGDISPTEAVYQKVSFSFQLNSFIIGLYSGSSGLEDGCDSSKRLSRPLAQLELKMLVLKGDIKSDGKLSTCVVLVDVLLDDKRSSRTSGITRFMERSPHLGGKKNDMIDVTFLQEASGNKFLDVKIFNFTLVLCVDFLMSVAQFFSPPQNATETKSIASSSAASSKTKTKAIEKPPVRPTSNTKINFKLEQPDILLIEDINDINSPGILLRMELAATLRITPDITHISSSVCDLQLKTCCTNPENRLSTLSDVLSPTSIYVTCNQRFGEGMRADVNVTDIVLHVTPSTIQLLSKISAAAGAKTETCQTNIESVAADYSGIWDQKDITEDGFWFLKTEVAEEALDFDCSHEATEGIVSNIHEEAIIEIKCIIVTVEMDVGTRTIPLILLEASLSGKAEDWSKQLRFTSCFTLETASYNERLAVWEPLIEPVQGTKEHRSWELSIDFKNNVEDDDCVELELEEDMDEFKIPLPKSTLNIHSNDTLQLTVTKTSMCVIQSLLQAFSEAVSSNLPSRKELPSSPYTVRNDTGQVITLMLENQDFEVLNDQTCSIKEVRLEVGTTVALALNAKCLPVANRSVLKEQDSQVEHKLMIKVNEMDTVRPLCVTKMVKRYFPLPKRTYPGDQWGLVTEISSNYGYKTIALRSNVQISNHMSVPIDVYHMTEGGNEVQFCGTADPNSVLNLPLNAVYTVTNEIFFCPKYNGYTVSIVPFVWKDLLKNPNLSKMLQCNSRDNTGLPFFMNAIGEIEQVYYEDTQKKTMSSTCFVIRLYATVVLCNFLPLPITYNLKGSSSEVILQEGRSQELLTAQLDKSSVTLKIPDYLGKDWVCTVQLISEMPVICTFETTDEPKLTLDLGIHSQNNGDFQHLTLYCPFWMINKTGLQLSYMGDDSGNFIVHPPSVDTPILFSFRPKMFFSKKKASIKVDTSEWSDKFSLDTVGSSGNVLCKSKIGHNYEVGLDIRLTSSGLSKIVVFTPFYLLVNNCSFSLEFRESQSPSQDWHPVLAGECQPFWPKYAASKKEIVLRVVGTADETKPFTFYYIHTTFLSLVNCKGGLNVSCKITESSVVLSVEEYADGVATVRLVNHNTEATLEYWQSGSSKRYGLDSGKYLLYTWDDPTLGQRELTWGFEGQKEMKDGLMTDGIGEYKVRDEKLLYWVSFLDGMQRVLMFTDDLAIATNAQCAGELELVDVDISISLHAIGLSLVNDKLRREVAYIALASSGVVWESRKVSSQRHQPFNLKDCQILEAAFQKYQNELLTKKKDPKKRQLLDGRLEVDFENCRLYRPNIRVIRRNFLPGLWFQYQISPHRQQYHARINKLQIDNQLDDCVFPTVFAPVPIPKSVSSDTAPKPFVEASIIMRTSEHSTVKQFKYFKVLIQEFHIKLDLGFINALIEFVSEAEADKDKQVEQFHADLKSTTIDLCTLAEITSSQGVKNFYDCLHFSPMKIHISFSMQGGNSDDSKQPSQIHSNLLNLLLQSVGFTLTDIQDVVFRLAYFEREHVFLTQKQLTGEVILHYSSQAIKQMYVLVLGLDVIGNPFGLVTQLGKGVEDFFYEPFQGAIQGPEEFAEGLALGVKSLLGSAVGGAAGAVSRITGTLGKGIATLTMDDDYQRKRREAMNRRPANLQEGLARSGKGLVTGVYDGVTGVFLKPIEGAKEEGVEGFFKGVGKGVLGLVTRPTSGVIDFASGSLEAVKRVTDMSEEVNRLRPPRYFQADGVVRSYNVYEAEGNRLLKVLEKGKFSETDVYVAHIAVTQDEKSIFIVTDKRLVMISKGDIFGSYNCEWQLTYPEIKEPQITTKGLEIMFREKKKKVMGIFGTNQSGKIVEIKSRETLQWILKKILAVMKINC